MARNKKKDNSRNIAIAILVILILIILILAFYFYGAYKYSKGYNQSKEAISNLSQALQQKQGEVSTLNSRINQLQNDLSTCSLNLTNCTASLQKPQQNQSCPSNYYSFVGFDAYYTKEAITQILTIFAIVLPISFVLSLFRIAIKFETKDLLYVIIILLIIFAIISMIILSG